MAKGKGIEIVKALKNNKKKPKLIKEVRVEPKEDINGNPLFELNLTVRTSDWSKDEKEEVIVGNEKDICKVISEFFSKEIEDLPDKK